MKEAAPIVGPLEFEGMKNNIILVEHDEGDDMFLLSAATSGKINIIFSSEHIELNKKFDASLTVCVQCGSIAMVKKVMNAIPSSVDFIIVNRIDLMDNNFSKKERGAQIKGHVSMLASKKILNGANMIITSCSTEYSLRDLANSFLNLRK